ncbi:hypothetical protein [Streptomyces sp. NPDC058382]|uniref:hypothetical protein n=1 Tax=unclassified Streptomyces TaxID=2593676 RepID=UPI003641456B
MPSLGAGPDPHFGNVPSEHRMPSTVDRVITGLSWWWVTAPLILATPAVALAVGFPQVREEFGKILALSALGSAVVAPAVGFAVALTCGQRQARRRFAIMGAVTSVPVLFFWIFGVLLAECPDGYHC